MAMRAIFMARLPGNALRLAWFAHVCVEHFRLRGLAAGRIGPYAQPAVDSCVDRVSLYFGRYRIGWQRRRVRLAGLALKINIVRYLHLILRVREHILRPPSQHQALVHNGSLAGDFRGDGTPDSVHEPHQPMPPHDPDL